MIITGDKGIELCSKKLYNAIYQKTAIEVLVSGITIDKAHISDIIQRISAEYDRVSVALVYQLQENVCTSCKHTKLT